MKQLFKQFALAFIACLLPAFALAQVDGLSVRGYTDRTGKLLPSSGSSIRLSVTNNGGKTTATITGLEAYGEANVDGKDGDAQRLARYSDKPDFFEGGTVYALYHGDKWRGGRTASSTKLDDEKGVMVLAKGPVGKDQVVLSFPSLKAEKEFDCQSVSFLLVRKGGDKDVTLRHWLGHPGYARTNDDVAIGEHMVLAQDDQRFPATAFCYDKTGAMVPLTTKFRGMTLRQHLARSIQRPEGVGAAKVAKQD
jgi:hypothetical protein